MSKRNTMTISIPAEFKRSFSKYCDSRGFSMSARLVVLAKKDMSENGWK